jgi:FMN-dependent NADH-azoreductase
MIVVGKNGEGQQIDSEQGSEVPESLFDPNLSVVVVDTGHGILAEEPTASDRAVEHVEDLNFVGINDFTARLSSHPNVS